MQRPRCHAQMKRERIAKCLGRTQSFTSCPLKVTTIFLMGSFYANESKRLRAHRGDEDLKEGRMLAHGRSLTEFCMGIARRSPQQILALQCHERIVHDVLHFAVLGARTLMALHVGQCRVQRFGQAVDL